MRKISFDPQAFPPELQTWWSAWLLEAEQATKKIVKYYETNGKPPASAFDGDVWGDFKHRLLEQVFHNKCAYCETHIGAARQPGDAEHYRPKGAVKNRNPADARYVPTQQVAPLGIAKDQRKSACDACRQCPYVVGTTLKHTGVVEDHPGYFWLAYHWKNLLPACSACNALKGKKNQFPTTFQHLLLRRVSDAPNPPDPDARPSKKWSHWYYPGPDELNRLEKPLLLNPYVDKPEQELRFGKLGLIAGITPKGKHSVCVFNLCDLDLSDSRWAAQKTAYNDYMMAKNNLLLDDEPHTERECQTAGLEKVSDFVSGKARYSAAVCTYLKDYCQVPI